jgi:hypothetical protein
VIFAIRFGVDLVMSFCLLLSLAAGDGFEEGAGLGKGTGVDGIHVKNWYGEKEEALHVTKGTFNFRTCA